jgi:hypothetical protein
VSGIIPLTSTIVITNTTVIDAAGQNVTLSGGGAVRVLQTDPNVALTLKELTIANGLDSATFNGCGGVTSQGELTVIACTFSNNVASAAADGTGALRHWNSGGYLTVVNSTFVNNRGGGSAGAIDTGFGSFTYGVRLTNCTFTGNSGAIGAVLVREPIANSSWMINCTVARNTNLFDASVKEAASSIPTDARLEVVNTIVAHPVGGTSGLGFIDAGHNLSSDNSAVFTNTTSLLNTDPLLGPLADNGGATWTMGLLPGSPALDAADSATAPLADQRGISRPLGVAADIGAIEGTQGTPGTKSIRFWAANYSVGESGMAASIRVLRTGPSSGASSVDFSAVNGTATDGLDFVATNVKVSFAAGDVQKDVLVNILDDNSPEGNETILLSLANPSGAMLEAPTTATLTILDDETPQNLVACTYDGVFTAISNGGWYVFDCDATIVFPAVLNVISNTLLDANGHNVVLDGNGASRLFNVDAGKMLTLKNMTLTRGHYASTNAPQFTDGSEGAGGAITVKGGTLNLVDCRVTSNSVAGGRGGGSSLGSTGSGGAGLGGAISVNGGALCATRTVFVNNQAFGGDGGSSGIIGGAHGSGGLGGGGAILNHGGSLTLQDCTFSQNLAQGGAAPTDPLGAATCGGAIGGAIVTSNGNNTIAGCLFESNVAVAAPGTNSPTLWGGEALGGATYFQGSASLANSTFTLNRAVASLAAPAYGGGVFQSGGVLAAVNVTLAGNGAFAGTTSPDIGQGGNLATTNGTLQLVNTIVANCSSGDNCFGTVVDLGHNISSDVSAAFSTTGSLNDTDPKLEALADNGGPTRTMALLAGSPALNAADNSAAPATDQRGLLRPFGSGDDIGSYEWATPFAIQGRVTGATLTNEVTITIDATPMPTTNGWFGLVGQSAGTYTVTPSDANYVFVPASRTVSVGPDALGADFAAYRRNMLSLDGLSYGMLDIAYAGTNAQVIRVLVSTNGIDWYPRVTNSIGTNNVLGINSPVDGPLLLFRTERIH